MSEGEFKKRILSMDIEEEDAVRVATFLDVLVEAKKEFPKEEDYQGWKFEDYLKIVDKWFKKWFGEKEK